jgi:hypothetical protein
VRIIIECPERILHLEAEYIYADCPFAQLQTSCSPAADHTLTPILPTGSDGCVYNSVPVQLKVQIVRYERVQAGLSITVPHGG